MTRRLDGGLRRRRNRRGGAIVELTPLIDITFQLLIFFLLTATFQDSSSLDVDLARAKNQQKTQDKKAVLISIAADGQLEIDSKLVDQREFEMRLCMQGEAGKTGVHIRADRETKHESLVFVMDVAKRCGFAKLGILHAN
ncbi:MAG: biopolymer transporter ExbD [Myxococcales bacterium FL481]|nr:MAG: biopolymer transporter ExbD [Myxococcales bacterium FL481]